MNIGETMRELIHDEVKKIQIDILDYVAQFCENHNINYWLDCGTLLGAVRHKGYIPWDDDIDVGMLRGDYDRFCDIFNKESHRYRFVNIDNTPGFYVAFGKVIDTNTVLYEPDEKGNKLSINIDIFVYDNAPDDNKKLKQMFNKRDIFLNLSVFSRGNQILPSDSMIRRIIKSVSHFFCRFLPKDYLVKMILVNSKKYCNIQTKRIGNFTGLDKMVCDKKVFNDFLYLEFEGKKYKAPVGYHEYLTAFYNNYMELPPLEQRVTHHRYKAYSIELNEGS